VRLYDTARQAVVPVEPGPLVSMYACGITPYDSAHLGHAAVYVTFDILRRRLDDMGCRTRSVRNVTDVDDDILRKARELGVHYLDLAAEEMARFDADMAELGILAVDSEPRATSAIPDILSLIGAALEAGHAYESEGAVYFDMTTFSGWGKVSHFSEEEMLALAAEQGGNPGDPAKRHPLDFVLWQPSLPDEPSWESRWGPGRPGWHIECSALAMREIGPTVDIHGGGRDLVFPHHECETAQSESATGRQFVRHWLHVGLVSLGGEKMSKSLGNLVFVCDLLKEWEPAVIRLAILQHHYRGDWEWQGSDLEVAAERIGRWRRAPASDATDMNLDMALAAVRDRLDDDLDAPGALRVLDQLAAAGRPVGAGAALLGVDLATAGMRPGSHRPGGPQRSRGTLR
jgi:L-cysteine:1D-myo-inositol 2-amino-2-deoxy-alpha-D-glucopyranoside ligase